MGARESVRWVVTDSVCLVLLPQALGAYPESKQVQAVHLNIFLGVKGALITSPPVKECLEELQLVLSVGSESVDV